MTETVSLRAIDVTKSYSGVHALRGASFELRSGEVHALVGENGAGKSTLIRIITGAVEADSGTVELNGNPIINNSPRLSKSLGIAAIYQQPALFPDLSVAENICLGLERSSLWRLVDWRERRSRATHLLAEAGAAIDPDAMACDLSMPEQQMVEIARAIGSNARVLIMDEPTASLPAEEVRNLFQAIHRLKSRGVGIIYITHRLGELPLVADRVTVLRDGCSVETRAMNDVTQDELIRLMVGRDLSAIFPKRSVDLGQTALELRGLGCSASGVGDVSLSIRRGEIVGVAGLAGAGRTELARTIFGLTPGDRGEIWIGGEHVSIASPAQAIARGIAYVPEDRRSHGVINEMSISANISLALLDELSGGWSMDFRKEREIARDYVERFGIKTPALFVPVATLSGGNQQKVALSRWLATRPSVLILDEPTQGIDVGGKSEVHELIVKLAEQGVAILMISSDLPEILGMSDRVAVMREGKICAMLGRSEATQQNILALALGIADIDRVTQG
jgi:rhamnose transport system ATP-binding protein